VTEDNLFVTLKAAIRKNAQTYNLQTMIPLGFDIVSMLVLTRASKYDLLFEANLSETSIIRNKGKYQ